MAKNVSLGMVGRGSITLLGSSLIIIGWDIIESMRLFRIIWLFTCKKRSTIAFALMVIAAVLTIVNAPLGWWIWFGRHDDAGGSITTSQYALPTMTPGSTSLVKMLRAARSVKTHAERNRALRIVAEAAVEKRNYDVAIKAGAASPTHAERSKTLTFVAICAAKEGLFELAIEAADKIPIRSIHDSTKLDILTMKSKQESSESIQTIGTPVSADCR